MKNDIAHHSGQAISTRPGCSHPTSHRKGLTLLLVIVCLVVLTTIVGAMVRQMAISNRQVRLRERSAQSTWLAESAIQRAAFRLRQDAGYQGETWSIPKSETGFRHDAQVKIEVKPLRDDQDRGVADNSDTDEEDDETVSGPFTISVAATFPVKSDYSSTVRKQITFSKPQTITNEDQDTGATP